MSAPTRKKKPPLKRLAGRLLRLLAARPQGRQKLRPDQVQRILLIRYDRLGDMVITTPLIESLHSIAPHAEIDILASWRNSALIANDPRVHSIYRWGGSPVKRLQTLLACRKRRYDLTFQLILWRTTLPGLLAGLLTPHGRVVSRDDPNNRVIFDHTYKVDSTTHYCEQVYGFLEAGLDTGGNAPTMPPYSLYIEPDAEKKGEAKLQELAQSPGSYVLLNISAGERERELSQPQLIELVSGLQPTLARHHLHLIISGGPADQDQAARIIEAVNSDNISLYFGSLQEALVAIRDARCIITPDTGTNHLASALQTPTVVFFTGNGRPVGWGPRVAHHRVVMATEGNDASALNVRDIVDATAALLHEISHGTITAKA